MEIRNKKTRKCSSLLFRKCDSSSSLHKELLDGDSAHLSDSFIKRKPGWKAMPYILGMEAMEKLGSYGLTANLMVYLVKEFHMNQVEASNVINIWDSVSNFLPIIGAIIADVFLGKFLMISLTAFVSLLGMVVIILTASMPQLRPPPCAVEQHNKLSQCIGGTQFQQTILLFGLCCLSIGAGGIRPCSIPFGVDQFDTTTPEGRKQTNSYYNWYYTLVTLVMLIDQTIVVYIQDTISWALGFAVPVVLMSCAIILFLAGRNFYVYIKPEGSNLSSIAQVFVAAHKKRKLNLPTECKAQIVFSDTPLEQNEVSKLSLSTDLRFLNKAAMIEDKLNELKPDGTCSNPWRLCSIQKVEEVKRMVKVIPIWASGIICFIIVEQQGTFAVSQALKMDRHMGTKYQIPAGSMGVISLITIAIWLPIYDRLIQPAFQKILKNEQGITSLQRIGLGYICSILCMLIAGLVERERRSLAISLGQIDSVAPLSVLWLAPQLMFLGFCQVLSIVGHTEFYNREFPEKMRSIGNSMVLLSTAGGSYLSSVVVNIVHNVTGKNGQPDWLTNDINFGKLDYFYFLLAGSGVLNFVYFVFCSRGYHYKLESRRDKVDADYESLP